jgi:hypothetical protein
MLHAQKPPKGKPDFQSVTEQNHVTDEKPHETAANIDLSRRHASPVPMPEEREEMLI